MKHGRKPTREQMKLMVKWKLDPTMWLVVKDTPERMELVHRGAPRSESEMRMAAGGSHTDAKYEDKTKIVPKGGREE